jgi:poly(A) polymerase
MKLDAEFIRNPATQTVLRCIEAAGYSAYFVGGCVRNAILGAPVQDIDLAISASPSIASDLFEKCDLKVVPTGIEHGTITVVSDGLPHEVTTFRKDVATDGRRAVVAFSDDISDDARRRDFTMNALYADKSGNVVDPLNGLPDLKERRVRFIENADQRIKEDFLRSLRFFRFHAWYGDPNAGLDAEALAAIAENLDGLDGLSAERVGAEMLKLLASADPTPAVAAMTVAGVLTHILPGADSRLLGPLVHNEMGQAANPIRRLAVLGGQDVSARLRLSRDQARQLDHLRAISSSVMGPAELGFRFGEELARDGLLIRSTLFEQPLDPADFDQIRFGAGQKMPVRASDLMPNHTGKELGIELKRLEKIWIDSNFTLGRDDLLMS